MKFCVIGASHTACLKQGWELVRDQFPDLDMVFFASPGSTLRHLRVRDGHLVSIDPKLTKSMTLTSGGLQDIVPGDFDAFILYGLILRLPRLRRGISRAVMLETMKDIAEKGLTVKVARRLRSVTDTKVWIGANPMKLALGGRAEPGMFYDYGTLLAELHRTFAVPDVTFLRQPAESMGADLRTMDRYGTGSVRLMQRKDQAEGEAHPDDDDKHMNGDYGRLWLLQNLPLVVQGAAVRGI